MVTNANLFKDDHFRALVSKVASELERNISKKHDNPWSRFCKQIQGAIKRVGPRCKQQRNSKTEKISKRFIELSQIKTLSLSTTSDLKEWLQLKKEMENNHQREL